MNCNILLVAIFASSFVSRSTCSPTRTFLRVADDVQVPTASLVFPNITITSCGVECFKAGSGDCLGFQWLPYSSSDSTYETNNVADSTSSPEECSRAPVVGSTSRGVCGLLQCVPEPSTLAVATGSQMYFFRGKGNLTYGSIKAPLSYSMVCTYAYRVFDRSFLSYEDAERQCQLDGAELLTIKNAEEQSLIADLISLDDRYWIGVTDRQTEGQFIASDGTTPVYTDWDVGQPNNFEKDGEYQNCVMLYRRKWNDNQCSNRLKFICQIRFLEL